LRIVQLEKLSATNPPVRLLTEAMPYAGFDKQVPLEPYQQPTLLRARAGAATAYIAVLPHPWAVLTDAAGRFILSNVPPARHRLHVWHPQHAPTVWSITVASGQTAVATIELTPSR
jgi:hypothetical protein